MPRDPALSPGELQAFFSAQPHWSVARGGELERTFTFQKFLEGISFVQRLAAIAEEQDHHPDLDIRYTKVTVRLFTHDSKALTGRDVRLAGHCERLARVR